MKPFLHKANCAFETNPDPQFFYESPHHMEAMSRLRFISQDRGINLGVITGEIGSGKTLLCKMLAKNIDYSTRIVYIPSSNISFEAILHSLIYQLTGVHKVNEYQMDRYLLLNDFQKIVNEQIINTGSHLIIILDECQMISADCLENLKCLTNSLSGQPGLSIILCGQPELNQTLKLCPTVAQRVGLMYFLPYLSEEHVGPYIHYRLSKINKVLDIEDAAIEIIYRYSKGCPREINKICKIAFEHIIHNDKSRLSAVTLEMVIEDLTKQRMSMSALKF